jgi:hypothetical protein
MSQIEILVPTSKLQECKKILTEREYSGVENVRFSAEPFNEHTSRVSVAASGKNAARWFEMVNYLAEATCALSVMNLSVKT